MDVLGNLELGFSVAFGLNNLLYCLLGVTLGTLIGVLPGVGPLVTIAVLLPLTFGLPPEASLIMLAGIYYGAAYGGSTTAILVNLPGESSSIMTCLDGYQMARRGKAGSALAIAAIASFIAGCFGTVLIALFGPTLSSLALEFKSPEYLALMVMALVLTAVLSQGALLSGIAMALLGVVFGLVGTDVSSGTQRMTFGIVGLVDGISFVIISMGLFAIAEIVANLEQPQGERTTYTDKVTGLMPNLAEMKEAIGAILRGTAVGSFFGLLPGAGQTISSFAAYLVERRVSRRPERFGQGAIEGVAAPEAANNASAQTTFIPTLTLGIPGSPTMALMLGALIIQGIPPGPQVISQHPQLFWGLIASMWIGNLLLVVLNLPMIGLWVRLLKTPYRILYPAILVFSCIGVYSVAYNSSDILLAAFFGFLGYLFTKAGCAPAPFILGFVLGPMLEENFRRSMVLSRGDPSIFITHPISAGFLIATVAAIAATVIPAVRRRKDELGEALE